MCQVFYSFLQLTSLSYNLGRDWLVGNATSQSTILPTANLTNTSTYSGQTSFNNFTYTTTATYVSGLLQNSSSGINHYESVAVNGLNAIDGLVAVLTVRVVQQPGSSSSSRWVPISILCPLVLISCNALVRIGHIIPKDFYGRFLRWHAQ